MLVIFGWGSKIAEELRDLVDTLGTDRGLRDVEDHIIRAAFDDYPLDAERYFFCSGYLVGKKSYQMTDDERRLTWWVNFEQVASACDAILKANDKARICVMGSESGISGSHDAVYAAAKGRLHNYVQQKHLQPDQQLVGVAPSIIEDAGMTTRRSEEGKKALVARVEKHPKRRLLKSIEVARLVRFLLYEDAGYITNTVIRMNGGAHTI